MHEIPAWLQFLFPGNILPLVFVFSLLYSFTVPISEEIVLVLFGVLARTYGLPFWEVALVSYPGLVLSDFVYYGLARFLGVKLLRSRLLSRVVKAESLLVSELYFDRKGNRIVFICRFLIGIRLPTIIAAGLFRMKFQAFAFYDAVAAAIATAFWMGVGFIWSRSIEGGMSAFSRFLAIASPVVIIGAMLVVLRRIRAERQAIRAEIEKDKEHIVEKVEELIEG